MNDENLSFNASHPEAGKHEEFVTNTANPLMEGVYWKSKRLGNIAYDVNGNPVSGLRPVFKNIFEV